MNALLKHVRRRSWAAAVVASLAAHFAALGLAMRTVRPGDAAADRPLQQQSQRASSPIPIALITGRPANEQTEAGASAVSPVRRQAHVRAHPALYSARGGDAVAAEANLASQSAPLGDDAPAESGASIERGESLGNSDRVSSRQSSSVGLGASAAAAIAAERIAELHQRLASSARRCYPPAARRLRLRGEVGLHFCLGANGLAESRALRGSTGSALLDGASLDCVLGGALPAPGLVGCYDVQVRFSDER